MWYKNQCSKQRGPLYVQLIQLIEGYINKGILLPGERLPAERKLAALLGIHRATVVHALDILASRGVLIRRQGSGSFINDKKWDVLSYPIINWQLSASPPKRTYYQLKCDHLHHEATKGNLSLRDLANGDLPSRCLPALSLPTLTMQDLVRYEKNNERNLLGLSSLKQAISQYMYERFAMTIPLDQILITSGTQQSLFLISQSLLKPGDSIGIERPSYFYSLSLFQAAGLRLAAIECDEEGMKIEALENVNKKNRLKWIFVNPVFQNPSGRTMSGQRKKQLLAFCQQHRIGIVEDDAYSAIYFSSKSDTTPLKKLDQCEQVIYLGSLSKYIGSHIRLGWLIAPPKIVTQLAELRQSVDAGLSILPQLLANNYLSHHYQLHQKQLRRFYYKKALSLHQWLSSHYSDKFEYCFPKGGFYLYARFVGSQIEEDAFLHRWLIQHTIAKQGNEFGDVSGYLRLSYGHLD